MKKKTNTKMIIGVAVIVLALAFLIYSTTRSSTQYFMTVEELHSRQAELVGQNVRMSGVVLGDTITYDPKTLDISFVVAQIPGDHKLIERWAA